MGIYKYYSFNKFVLALGYKSNYIKQYFFNKNYSEEIDMIYTGKILKLVVDYSDLKNI